MTPEPLSLCVKAWKLGILGEGKRVGGPGSHRHSPVPAATHRLPSESSYKDVTTAPSLPSSPKQVVPPPRIAQSFPVGPPNPPAHTVPSRSSKSAITDRWASAGYSARRPSFQLAQRSVIALFEDRDGTVWA